MTVSQLCPRFGYRRATAWLTTGFTSDLNPSFVIMETGIETKKQSVVAADMRKITAPI